MWKNLLVAAASVTALVSLSACMVVPVDGPGSRRVHDEDRDGVPNRHDRDRDGDGVPNRRDRRPDHPGRY